MRYVNLAFPTLKTLLFVYFLNSYLFSFSCVFLCSSFSYQVFLVFSFSVSFPLYPSLYLSLSICLFYLSVCLFLTLSHSLFVSFFSLLPLSPAASNALGAMAVGRRSPPQKSNLYIKFITCQNMVSDAQGRFPRGPRGVATVGGRTLTMEKIFLIEMKFRGNF